MTSLVKKCYFKSPGYIFDSIPNIFNLIRWSYTEMNFNLKYSNIKEIGGIFLSFLHS